MSQGSAVILPVEEALDRRTASAGKGTVSRQRHLTAESDGAIRVSASAIRTLSWTTQRRMGLIALGEANIRGKKTVKKIIRGEERKEGKKRGKNRRQAPLTGTIMFRLYYTNLSTGPSNKTIITTTDVSR